jgi:hypothetical protein
MKRVFLLSGVFLIVGNVRADHIGHVITPKGTRVPVTVKTAELPLNEIMHYNRIMRIRYPNAVFIGNSSRKYNCHSFAWVYRDNIWLNAPHQETYWLDKSYRQVRGWPCRRLARISYRSGRDHSAVVFDPAIELLISKWGIGPKMIHTSHNCPYGRGSFVFWQFVRN